MLTKTNYIDIHEHKTDGICKDKRRYRPVGWC